MLRWTSRATGGGRRRPRLGHAAGSRESHVPPKQQIAMQAMSFWGCVGHFQVPGARMAFGLSFAALRSMLRHLFRANAHGCTPWQGSDVGGLYLPCYCDSSRLKRNGQSHAKAARHDAYNAYMPIHAHNVQPSSLHNSLRARTGLRCRTWLC